MSLVEYVLRWRHGTVSARWLAAFQPKLTEARAITLIIRSMSMAQAAETEFGKLCQARSPLTERVWRDRHP